MIKHFSENLLGKDYVVGDIHGCFEKLQRQLDEMGFDETKDRLFSVGDLVDRGPSSEAAIDWLGKSWFHAVRGNHEQMAIDFIDGNSDRYMYAYNGGQWFLDICDVDERVGRNIATWFRGLPLAIDISVGNKLFGIIHADCPGGDWALLEAGFKGPTSYAFENIAMWDRDRISNNIQTHVKNVDHVFVGHTPLKDGPKTLGNVTFTDTGACFGKSLTIIEINKEEE